MSAWALEVSRLARDRKQGWSDPEKLRFHEALDALCENPEAGRHYEDDDTWSYEDKSAMPHIHVTYRMDRTLRRIKVVVADCTWGPQDVMGAVADCTPPSQVREVHVFLSYSQADRQWFEELRRALRPLEELDIRFWCDQDIVSSQPWHELIREKISDASAALILVSKDFLQSQYIREHELARFLSRAEDSSGEPFLLLWVTLVSSRILELDDLGRRVLRYQALLDPKRPLSRLKSAKSVASALSKLREEAFRAIYRQLRKLQV